MSERGGSIEMNHEYTPIAEEIQALFGELVEGKKYLETQKLEDEKGLYRWDIEIPTEDGGKIEYLYIRKGCEGAEESTIHMVYYDKDGVPYGGSPVMKCNENGLWRKIP